LPRPPRCRHAAQCCRCERGETKRHAPSSHARRPFDINSYAVPSLPMSMPVHVCPLSLRVRCPRRFDAAMPSTTPSFHVAYVLI
jgi:hypothetical protein